jgi:hypothetical protein
MGSLRPHAFIDALSAAQGRAAFASEFPFIGFFFEASLSMRRGACVRVMGVARAGD